MLQREQLALKSLENWTAAATCRTGGHRNAAASRFYYALYQAIRFWADKKGLLRCVEYVPDVHATVASIVGKNGGDCARELREAVNDMYELRVKADYKPEPVEESDLEETVKKAGAARAVFLK